MTTRTGSAALLLLLLALPGLPGCGGGGIRVAPSPPKVTLDLSYDPVFRYTCDSETLPCPTPPDLGSPISAANTIYMPSAEWRSSQTRLLVIDVRAIDLTEVREISVRLTFDVGIVDDGGGVVTNFTGGRIVTFPADPASPVAAMTRRIICRLDASGEALAVSVAARDAASATTVLPTITVSLD